MLPPPPPLAAHDLPSLSARGAPPAGAADTPAPDVAALLDRLPVAVFQLLRSAHGGWSVPFASRELLRRFTATGAGTTAIDPAAAFDRIHADDRDALTQQLRLSRQSGRPWKARFRLLEPDGQTSWLEASATPQMTFGGGTLWHGVVSDVSFEQGMALELQELHARWAAAALAAGLGVVEADLAEQTVRLDAIACGHHGIDAEQATLGLDAWRAAFDEADRLLAHAAVQSAAPVGGCDTVLLRLAAPDGAVRTLEFTFRRGAQPQRRIGTCRDVTPQQTVEALRRERLVAQKASRSKSEFMSRVSHELRTPLNGVLGFAQLMLRDQAEPLPPVHRERAEVLHRSAARLLSLIDQLLDVARMEQGRITLRTEAVDAGPLIERCVAAMMPLATARDVVFQVECADDAVAVRADPHALEQVVDNLLSNAVKYNRERGTVRIRLKIGDRAVLVVDDTGLGMDEAQLSMLFEPFNRLGAEHSGVPGSGLGLVITRKLVHAMGGTLEVFSKVGRGSRFVVSLPIAQRARPADAPPPAPVWAAPPTAAGDDFPSAWDAGEPKVVLYVEDDEVNTILMQQIFAPLADHALITALAGEEGLALAAKYLPQIVLLDLNMPGMSGYDVLRSLRADPQTAGARVIAVSAEAQPDQIQRALDAGFDDYLTKPIHVDALVAKLRRDPS